MRGEEDISVRSSNMTKCICGRFYNALDDNEVNRHSYCQHIHYEPRYPKTELTIVQRLKTRIAAIENGIFDKGFAIVGRAEILQELKDAHAALAALTSSTQRDESLPSSASTASCMRSTSIPAGGGTNMAVYTPTSGIGQVLHLVGAGLSQIGRLFR